MVWPVVYPISRSFYISLLPPARQVQILLPKASFRHNGACSRDARELLRLGPTVFTELRRQVPSAATPEVRISALRALAFLGDTAAISDIAACLEDANGDVRVSAAWAIAKLSPCSAPEELYRFLVAEKSLAVAESACWHFLLCPRRSATDWLVKLLDRSLRLRDSPITTAEFRQVAIQTLSLLNPAADLPKWAPGDDTIEAVQRWIDWHRFSRNGEEREP